MLEPFSVPCRQGAFRVAALAPWSFNAQEHLGGGREYLQRKTRA